MQQTFFQLPRRKAVDDLDQKIVCAGWIYLEHRKTGELFRERVPFPQDELVGLPVVFDIVQSRHTGGQCQGVDAPRTTHVVQPFDQSFAAYGVPQPQSRDTEEFGHGTQDYAVVLPGDELFGRALLAEIHESLIQYHEGAGSHAESVNLLDEGKGVEASGGVARIAKVKRIVPLSQGLFQSVHPEGKVVFRGENK